MLYLLTIDREILNILAGVDFGGDEQGKWGRVNWWVDMDGKLVEGVLNWVGA